MRQSKRYPKNRRFPKVSGITPILSAFFLISMFIPFLNADIINTKPLKNKKKREFKITRDIFSPVVQKFTQEAPKEYIPPPPPPKTEEKEKPQEQEKDMAMELTRNVTYEGYVVRDSKRLALLSVSGEFFVVKKEDMILDKMEVVKIDTKEITVKVGSQEVQITIKGDEENEQK